MDKQFSKDITDTIHNSGAYSNKFFDTCKAIKTISVENMLPYCRNWYFVTKHFAIAGLTYNRLVGQLLKSETDKEQKDCLQRAIIQSLQINAEDFGLGLQNLGNPEGPSGIHYILFGDMSKKVGLNMEELDMVGLDGLEKETLELIESIEKNFSDAIVGTACFRVVEAIAFNIVESMLPLFLAIEKDGKKVYKQDELAYITLHLNIEKRHDVQSGDMVTLLATTPDREQMIRNSIEELSQRFGNFWSRMYQKTFEL